MIFMTDGDTFEALDTADTSFVGVRREAFERFVWDIAKHPKVGKVRTAAWLGAQMGRNSSASRHVYYDILAEAREAWRRARTLHQRRNGLHTWRRKDIQRRTWRDAEAQWHDERLQQVLEANDLRRYGRVLGPGENPFGVTQGGGQ